MSFGKKLKEYRIYKNLSQEELANKLNTTKQVISRYEREERSPKLSVALDIANKLNLPVEQLIDDSKALNLDGKQSESSNAEFVPTVNAPLFASVSAGFGSTREEAIGTFPCVVRSEEEAANTLCVIVSGNSMAPTINDGDIIQVRRQTSVDYGDLAVVMVDGEHFVKKVEYGADYIRLVSLNEEYPPRVLRGREVLSCSVVGKVIGSFKRF